LTIGKWRFWFLGMLMIAGFTMLVTRLVTIQVRGSDEYAGFAQSSMTKKIHESGSRGQILDKNSAVLAYDKKIYNIEFYRDPTSGREKNGQYSKAIWEVIKLLKGEGREVKFDFWLSLDEDKHWVFDTKTKDEGVAKARERMFRSNFYVTTLPVEDIYERLCANYMIHAIDEGFSEKDKLTFEDKLQVLSVWQEMQMNAFNSVPIVLVRDIKWATVMEVETRLVTLPGISVSVQNQRVYPKGTLAAHVVGYTGLIQGKEQMDQYLEQGYLRTDTIGLDGIERSMEQWLTPNMALRRGYSLVEIDRAGKVIRQLEKQDPADGNTVRLTIDSAMQQVVETELEKVVNGIRDFEEKKVHDPVWLEENRDTLMEYEESERQINYAENGAIVVLDMQCRVLAMASYPSYDPNIFIVGTPEQKEQVLLDKRNRLFNNAIASASTPGSVFKMTTALAALVNGKITLWDEIDDKGAFDLYDVVHPPRCWVPENMRYTHQRLDVKNGIAKSCNYFFYTLGSYLHQDSGNLLYEYAAKLGLTSRTNIDLPGEIKSIVGSQTSLYDPARPITGFDQDTWLPVQIKNAIKKHLKRIGEENKITYSEERLDKCVKALMDMAVTNDQGAGLRNWMRLIRPILMEELGMSMELVWRAATVGDIGRYLNEIKWGGTNAIMTAIGQGITMVTPINMARYVAAVANGGYVYDVQIVDSIVSTTGEVVRSFQEPVLVNDLSREVAPYIAAIHAGMEGVVDDDAGTAGLIASGWKHRKEVAAKTGTAQTSYLDVENNSWFVSFAPLDNPEIAVVVFVPHGYGGKLGFDAAAAIIDYYFDARVDEVSLILPAPNGLAQ